MTISVMAMTLRLTESEQQALRERAKAEGISMQEAARRAVREFVVRGRTPRPGRLSSALRHGRPRRRTAPTRAVTDPAEYVDFDDLIDLARTLLGDPPPVCDIGLLGSAAARPQTTVMGQDAYPDVFTKAAALLHSIVNNRTLVDGNKRLGWLATAVFLGINGIVIAHADNDDVYGLVIDVAAGSIDAEHIATGMRHLVVPSAEHL